MFETLDQPSSKKVTKDRSILLGFTCAISWVWASIFLLFMWYLMNNVVEMVKPYSIWEVGGYIFRSFLLELITLIGSSVVIVSTFLLFYEIHWGIFVYVAGQLTFMSMQVWNFTQMELHDTRSYFILGLWTVIPLLLIILMISHIVKTRSKS